MGFVKKYLQIFPDTASLARRLRKSTNRSYFFVTHSLVSGIFLCNSLLLLLHYPHFVIFPSLVQHAVRFQGNLILCTVLTGQSSACISS